MKIKNLLLTLAGAAVVAFSCQDPVRPPRPDNGSDQGGQDKPVTLEHKGTVEDPYSVADAIAFTKALGSDVQSENDVYIKGVVTSIKEAFGSFGNVTLYIGDTATSTETFYVYRVLGLGNKKCSDPDAVKEGDEVVVCGKVVNFKGNTPETVQGSAFLYSINGKSEPVDNPVAGEAKGTGTEADPFNVAAAIAKCQEAGTTATTEVYFVTGKVTAVDESGAVQYGNITLDLVDEGSTAVFKAYRIKSVGGAAFTSEGNVQVGDVVVVKGQLVNYSNNTPETAQNTGELVSVNGQAPTLRPAISVKASTQIASSELEAVVEYSVVNPVAGKSVTIADVKDGGVATVTLEAAAVKVVFATVNETENAKEVSFTLKYEGASDAVCTVIQKAKPSGEEGATVTFDATADLAETGSTAAAWTLTKDGVTLSCSNGIGGNGQQYRIYKSQTITVSAPAGKKVLGVEFTCTAKGDAQYGPGCFTTASGYTFADEVGTWAGEEESVVFTATTNQVRATKIVVTLSK